MKNVSYIIFHYYTKGCNYYILNTYNLLKKIKYFALGGCQTRMCCFCLINVQHRKYSLSRINLMYLT